MVHFLVVSHYLSQCHIFLLCFVLYRTRKGAKTGLDDGLNLVWKWHYFGSRTTYCHTNFLLYIKTINRRIQIPLSADLASSYLHSSTFAKGIQQPHYSIRQFQFPNKDKIIINLIRIIFNLSSLEISFFSIYYMINDNFAIFSSFEYKTKY